MKINLKQPKYVLPLIGLPFLLLFFYVYHSSSGKASTIKVQTGINGTVGEVSEGVKKKELADKLDAYRNAFKEADGLNAVSPVPTEGKGTPAMIEEHTEREKKMLDSINLVMKHKFSSSPAAAPDEDLNAELNHFRQSKPDNPVPKEKDPMELFRQQMAVMDSLAKANDPEAKAEAKKKAASEKLAALSAADKPLPVAKPELTGAAFNTIKPVLNNDLITAVIDENMTGFAGSRVRLRLLEDITVGSNLIKKGTYLYALINGFAEQRVMLAVRSVFFEQRLLPVKLDLYDMDGMPGLFVPNSAFRDFTKDLGTNTVQGVSLDGSSSFVMSTASKMFQSTSTAIAGMIRKDKVKLKYNSYIYLIDNNIFQNQKKN